MDVKIWRRDSWGTPRTHCPQLWENIKFVFSCCYPLKMMKSVTIWWWRITGVYQIRHLLPNSHILYVYRVGARRGNWWMPILILFGLLLHLHKALPALFLTVCFLFLLGHIEFFWFFSKAVTQIKSRQKTHATAVQSLWIAPYGDQSILSLSALISPICQNSKHQSIFRELLHETAFLFGLHLFASKQHKHWQIKLLNVKRNKSNMIKIIVICVSS